MVDDGRAYAKVQLRLVRAVLNWRGQIYYNVQKLNIKTIHLS